MAKGKVGAPEGNQNALGNEGGRPTKYDPKFAKQVFKLCLLGAKDTEIAKFFEVDLATINNWKKVHIEFLESITRGKRVADTEVANSLYQRAKGFTKKAVKIMQSEGVPVYAEYKEYYPPDVKAIEYWLNNRQKRKWKKRTDITSGGEKINFNYHKPTE